ncbi:MAG: glycine--tRNA ligase [Candidatus Levybacteria bacterium]|nr:glycine--tRNA ligase [Candidatus Levybacteria bacterium]
MVDTNLMEKIVALCKRRGFVFPGSEIYGGLNGTWDLGPLGVALANNIKSQWWKAMVLSRDDVVGLDSSIIHHSKVWEASGHISSFTDPLVECKICHERFRADNKTEIGQHAKSHDKSEWTDVKQFNLMFKTFVGPLDDEKNKTYLRPETAQGIFINFSNVLDSTRIKIPFGIAQIGKGFRNEITTGNFLFRVREFEMMELEYFVKPDESVKMHEYWKNERLNWYLSLGIKKENIKLVDLPKEDIAHYSKGTAEIWYKWPFFANGQDFGELEGIANRGDYDLSRHSKYSGRDLSYFDQETNERYIPYVIEPSVGVGRAMLAFLLDAYHEDGTRVLLRLHPKIAPFKVAVFPLLANKENLVKKARSIYESLKPEMMVSWDDRGNIGKRYASQDEIGTPFCITVDFQSLEDDTVTVRYRDSAKQERIKSESLLEFFQKSTKQDLTNKPV